MAWKTRQIQNVLLPLALCLGCGGIDDTTTDASTADTTGSVRFQLDGWSDNWFAAYLGDTLLIEDSVPITTERSFNAESVQFDADYPLQLNFVLKDYIENDTGLEYIGETNQQMGDGGFIAQITEVASGSVVGVTTGDFRCLVIHEAPLDISCESESAPVAGTAPCEFRSEEEPTDWKAENFDDSSWSTATVHLAASVDPKLGYDDINWDSSADFIWGEDLETDNTILCRTTIAAP